ncbi:SAM-dependent methyltransferase [Paenibacillus profundus]|uniref:SAM-dependent methyltransferase n=1 Tax=Paenibacillus profundus TaxID=1173085 RepID=A0ABS8YP53_9BACL|nr:SAM-dependent methyltransferase [Paenibacillus profundus]MCE5172087.1 SAM-dependent methyltransferase [Paenibacillus profundus]
MEPLHQIHLEQHFQPASHWVITSNHGFISYAQEELRRSFGQLKSRMLVSGETALMELPADAHEVLRLLEEQPAIFIRHIQPVHAVVEESSMKADLPASAGLLVDKLFEQSEAAMENIHVAVHVRSSVSNAPEDKALRDALRAAAEAGGALSAVQNPAFIISLFIHEGMVYAGLVTPAQAGSDWPGGAIRFQREEGQVSRAKFKLLEAERTFGLEFSAYRNALDVGAAPGGWTSLLLERGVHVTAVDPAKMHPSLMNHPRLSYFGKNAGEVAFEPYEFDLLVCDMSWSPKVTAKLVIQLLDSVISGGTVIVTVKLMHKKPLQTIRDVTEMFSEHMQILRAKQLFHNRDEITLYMLKY